MAQYMNMANPGLTAVGSGFYQQAPKALTKSASNRQIIKDESGMSDEFISQLLSTAVKGMTQSMAEDAQADAAFQNKLDLESEISDDFDERYATEQGRITGIDDKLNEGGSLSLGESQRMAAGEDIGFDQLAMGELDATNQIIADEGYTQGGGIMDYIQDMFTPNPEEEPDTLQNGMSSFGSRNYRNRR